MSDLPTILHVEDDADILCIAGIALGSLGGFELRQFSSGMDAVRAAPRIEADLLLLDMMMPGLDGLETLACLRSHHRFQDTPAILCTAKTVDLPDEVDARAMGIIGTLRKPFETTRLPAQILQIWTAHRSGERSELSSAPDAA